LAYAGGLSYPAIWGYVRAGKFPSPRQVGSRVFWVESELAAWLISRPVADWAKEEKVA
jgi:predicted DNA-binding transcriptional regulator AlpA